MLLHMDIKQLTKFLIDGQRNPDDYAFIVVSDNVYYEGKFKNVNIAPELMPSPYISGIFIDDGNTYEYQQAYYSWLTKPENLARIALLVKAVIKDDKDIILVNSPAERAFKTLDMIGKFITNSYGVPTYSWKDIKKHPEVALRKMTKEELSICEEKFERNIEMIKRAGVNIEPIINPEFYEEGLKKMKKKELRKFCRVQNILLSDDEMDDKKAIIQKIMHRIQLV